MFRAKHQGRKMSGAFSKLKDEAQCQLTLVSNQCTVLRADENANNWRSKSLKAATHNSDYCFGSPPFLIVDRYLCAVRRTAIPNRKATEIAAVLSTLTCKERRGAGTLLETHVLLLSLADMTLGMPEASASDSSSSTIIAPGPTSLWYT
mmetsp:Transcript_62339/g.103677  ORF Transcript_62339/g.103677 Transcript_62339/m.103677 type:complete len:149 (+) Transcript_62339:249-695(+)